MSKTHSHETGKLSHLERVIMLTQAGNELGIKNVRIQGDMHKVFVHVMQQAYEHGKSASPEAFYGFKI